MKTNYYKEDFALEKEFILPLVRTGEINKIIKSTKLQLPTVSLQNL